MLLADPGGCGSYWEFRRRNAGALYESFAIYYGIFPGAKGFTLV